MGIDKIEINLVNVKTSWIFLKCVVVGKQLFDMSPCWPRHPLFHKSVPRTKRSLCSLESMKILDPVWHNVTSTTLIRGKITNIKGDSLGILKIGKIEKPLCSAFLSCSSFSFKASKPKLISWDLTYRAFSFDRTKLISWVKTIPNNLELIYLKIYQLCFIHKSNLK